MTTKQRDNLDNNMVLLSDFWVLDVGCEYSGLQYPVDVQQGRADAVVCQSFQLVTTVHNLRS